MGMAETGRVNRTRLALPVLPALMASLLAVGCWEIGKGSWVYAKAGLAQLLLQRAWSRALSGDPSPKPWPWADTWPVARLQMDRLAVDLIILAGAHGRTLAFGPGHVSSTALPGQPGSMIVTGHRDTHFRFLQRVRLNDELDLTGADGIRQRYKVTDIRIMDSRRDAIALESHGHAVLFVTCFPFDAIEVGGPLRYLVKAEGQILERISLPARTQRFR